MRKSAFTLIELLVVIVIIGLLTSLATASYLKAQSRSRDSARKSGINTLSIGVETYYTQKHSFPGEASSNTGTYSTASFNEAGCKAVTSFTSGGYSVWYAYGPDATHCQLSGEVTPSDQPSASYQPVSTWIPGMGQYVNPFPKEPHFKNSTGGQTAIPTSGFANPVSDYLDSSDTTATNAASQSTNQTSTFIYRNLLGTGYAAYARLENTDDADFCGSPASSFQTTSGSCVSGTLSLSNNTPGGSLPTMVPSLSTITNNPTNPISVYIVRK